MNERTKESKFLDAISRYAEQQKVRISSEVEEYKAQKIEQATDSGLKDAYELIQREISVCKTAILTESSRKENALRQSLFAERQRIFDEVFRRAEERLKAYTETQEYISMVTASVQAIAEMTGGETCTVNVRVDDLSLSADITAILPGAEVTVDPAIRLGGVKVICHTKGILYDDTLDSRLKDQHGWFIEHSGLKVV